MAAIPPDVQRTALIRTADLYFWGLIWSTIGLFIGAVMEYLIEHAHFERWRIDLKARRLKPRHWVLFLPRMEWLAIILVVGGIGGEGIFEYLAAGAEDEVREFDARVSRAASEHADKIEGELEGERQKTAVFQTQSAKAQLELQNRLAWRHLNPEQTRRFLAILRPFRGSPVLVRVAGSDPEAISFAEEIAKMFFDAEWRPLLSREPMVIRIPVLYGVAWNVDDGIQAAKAFTEVASTIPTSNKTATLDASLATSSAFPAIVEVGLKQPP